MKRKCSFEGRYETERVKVDACLACARAALHVRSGAIRDARVRHKWNSDYVTVPMHPRPNKVTSDRQEQEEQFSIAQTRKAHTSKAERRSYGLRL